MVGVRSPQKKKCVGSFGKELQEMLRHSKAAWASLMIYNYLLVLFHVDLTDMFDYLGAEPSP